MKASTPLVLLALLSVSLVIAPSELTQVTSEMTPVSSGTTQVTSGTTQVTSGTTQVTSGTTQVTSGTTQATSGTTQVTSGATQVTSGMTQVTSGTTQVTSGTTQATSGTTQATSGTTQVTSGATQVTSGTIQATSGTTQVTSGMTQATSGTTQAPSGTTYAPSIIGSTPTQVNSSTPSSSGPSSLCQVSTCEGGAACLELKSKSICLCVEGYYYTSSSCQKGKSFPGYVIVQDVETTDLNNKSSSAYENLHDKITSFFQDALSHPDYGQTVILHVSVLTSGSGRSEMRAVNNGVNVSVVNILKQSTNLIEANVTSMIEEAIKSNSIGVQYYGAENRCEFYGCVETDQDNCNGLQCECKPGLQRPNPLSSFCVALDCPQNCSEELKKECLKKDSGEFECVCQAGYWKDANDVCKKCPFGYSGMGCEDDFQLILTIVGTIAGVLILGLLISLICLERSKNKKKNIEEQKLIDNDFQNLQLQSTGFSNFGADGSLFPKVRTTTSKDLHAQNPYANQRSVPRPDY